MRIVRGLSQGRKALARTLGAASDLPFLNRAMEDAFGKARSWADLAGHPAREVVEFVLNDVRQRGDAALKRYAELDGLKVGGLEVSKREIASAHKKVDKDVLRALELAARRLRAFHKVAARRAARGFIRNGVGQVVQPLERVGLYVPGGTASYPSTVLMTAIPARVAGVKEIIVATPPGRDGKIPAVTLAAAAIAGVDRVFKLGGAQAIAAMAYGTESVPRVDKICGPGNLFVTLAKKMVFGQVGIDGLEGPSEVVIIADDSADPMLCAADLLAQAEHDANASPIMITTSSRLAERVSGLLDEKVHELDRQGVVAQSLKNNGRIVVVESLEQAVDLASSYAPEHLSLMVRDPERWAPKVRNAGAIFLGQMSPVVMGDYVAGPSHVLPTGGTARFTSPLGVMDFLKVTSVISLDAGEFKELAPAAATLATAEGLQAHAQSVLVRLKSKKPVEK